MTYIERQPISHKTGTTLYYPAIALENFAIVIRPIDEIFEDCEAYQILHKGSGVLVATFSIVQPAIECLQELERVAGFCGKIKVPISKSEAALIHQIVLIAQVNERQHPEYWDDCGE